MIRPTLAAAVLLGFGLPAAAQDSFSLSYGAAVTSNYIDKGTSQSDGKPAVQGYVEGAYGIFYGGVWTSTVDIYGDNLEVDLYAGVRPELGGDLTIDFSYYRYLYDDSGDCCGEFILLAGYAVADIGEVSAEFDYDPVNDTQWGELGASMGIVAEFTLGGKIGTDFGSYDLGKDKVAWDVGVSRGLGDFATVDLRYYDSNDDPDTAVLTISVDF